MILKLKNGGVFDIRFTHHRDAEATTVEVCDRELSSVYPVGHGEAYCHPTDNYNKAIGRKVALTKAMKHLPRELRTQIWKAYFDFIGAKHACRECGMVGNHKMSCDTR